MAPANVPTEPPREILACDRQPGRADGRDRPSVDSQARSDRAVSAPINYDWFVLALDLLFLMKAVQFERGLVQKAALPNQLEQRFTHRLSALSSTERDATVRQRVRQDLFREGLVTLWRGRCAISGLDVPELLRASHAKPWAASTDAERLDVYNGLLLAAHLDAAFDAGLITILADGTVGASSALPPHAMAVLQLHARITVTLSPRHEAYLAWHRDHVFRR